MSICRIEDGVSDVYVFQNDEDLITIHVRRNVLNPNHSIPEGLTDLQEMEYTIKHFDVLYQPWDNPYAGEVYSEIFPIHALELLEEMAKHEVLIPDNVIPDLWKLIDYLDEPSVSDMNEAK